LKGDEKCPKCGHYNLELKTLLDGIDNLSRLQNKDSTERIQRMRESDKARNS
jgi:predicted nucleic-acid-binding Zn-ribbon protein